MEGGEETWSEAVEDLVDSGDTDKAISLLESVVSKLQTLNSSSSSSDLKLASALSTLAILYSSKGFSLKADELDSQASLLKLRAQRVLPSGDVEITRTDLEKDKVLPPNDALSCSNSTIDESLSDDWEAIADRAPDELLSSQCLPEVSELSLEDTKVQAPKRRGRGTFSYKRLELYSDQTSNGPIIHDSDETASHASKETTEIRHSRYGTRHVLVLADFPPSTRTVELEKLFDDFRDRGFVIRWVNDTVALAVFRTPSIALEASKYIQCPFTVRVLGESDTLMSSISAKDLEPPRQRPETSARTAKRLIAQGMGMKLPSETFGSKELRRQEEARRNRIVTRQNLKDDAWGADDVN
ncbi:hypothetical protein L1049_014004 [Liquidambar formosana]|uniref:Coiled-coil domain-containing protein R3HCC1L n=1 Tax=Liquidambar formosana TaxID=63359 RepID=A0AAP0WXA8_LIQFO